MQKEYFGKYGEEEFSAEKHQDNHFLSIYHRVSPNSNKIFIDVGANKGMYSFNLLNLWAENSEVIAKNLWGEVSFQLLPEREVTIHMIEPFPCI